MLGVKRDDSIFPKIKDENNGITGTTEQKHKLDHNLWMDQIFDIKYRPRSIDEINLFDLKKRFIYAIFTNTLLTDKGTFLVS